MKKKKGHLGLSNSFHYTLMVLPGYVWLFMFSIVPMVGIVMAFQDYNPSKGWFGSPPPVLVSGVRRFPCFRRQK